jgi:uncharacterized protein
MALRSDITTNAWCLEPPLASRLVELGMTQFQIALDGSRELHDRTRRRAGGGATFEVVWRNLCALAGLPGRFRVVVRLHVSRTNAGDCREFIATCAQAWGHDPRFVLFLRPLSALGGPRDSSFPFLTGAERAHVVTDLRQHAVRLGLHVAGEEDFQPVCYAARGNSFVVRADGRLGKCTVALEDAANTVGVLEENGSVTLDVAKMRRWMRGLWSGDAAELACPKRGWDRTKRVRIPIQPAAPAARA